MRIALLSDIHANREALAACLDHADRAGAQRLVFLGDLVGYGADPQWVVETVMARVARGAVALLGNHDEAAFRGIRGMSPAASASLAWTRGILNAEATGFLRALPLEIEEEDRLYVHAEASDPARWHYVLGPEEARRSMAAVPARLTLCGHVHVPRLYGLTATEKLMAFPPSPGVPVPLPRPRRYLAVLGAVGQPRDGNPAACYGMLDTARAELAWVRVPYDVKAAAAKIRAIGLSPPIATLLANRLSLGR